MDLTLDQYHKIAMELADSLAAISNDHIKALRSQGLTNQQIGDLMMNALANFSASTFVSMCIEPHPALDACYRHISQMLPEYLEDRENMKNAH